jgi:hypothetical protein
MKFALLTVLIATSLIWSQDISISGKVTNEAGQALQGVIVKLLTSKVADTTGSDGQYSLKGIGQSAARPGQSLSAGAGFRLQNNRLQLSTPTATKASFRLYTLAGSLVATVYEGQLRPGRTNLAFPFEKYSHGTFLLKARIGQESSCYRLLTMDGAAHLIGQSPAVRSGGLAKVAGGVDWLQAGKTGYTTHSQALSSFQGTIDIKLTAAKAPDFGANVLLFDPAMDNAQIQGRIDSLYTKHATAQFGTVRSAMLFKPGEYDLDVRVGYYTQVLGLGQSPDDVSITGAVRSKSTSGGSVLSTFWRAAENLAVTPTVEPTNVWAVSQAAPIRRVHVKGSMNLWDGGASSGGFMADCKVDGTVASGSQQQWFSRNTDWGSWVGGVWNMFFLGVENPPAGTWPAQPFTVVEATPAVGEKPFLYVDNSGNWFVKVPDLRKNGIGISWQNGTTAGASLPIDQFYIARPEKDNATSINAALSQGRDLLLTPGIYHLSTSLQIGRPGTVVLGLGVATLVADSGTPAVVIDDVDGVKLGGVLLDAGLKESPSLLQVGKPGSSADHAKNPICLYDLYCRVGGASLGTAAACAVINSRDVIGDHFWLWRADHGTGAAWTQNKNKNGLIVNGDNVTVYGLFVEHCQEYQTIWNGNGGRVYFYQCEIPYDPPAQDAWSHDGVNGYATYKVAGNVTSHEAWGLGMYCYFKYAPVILANAVETPTAANVKMHHLVTFWLNGTAGSEISHVINGTGAAVTTSSRKATVD